MIKTPGRMIKKTKEDVKEEEIQCRECKGFGHMQRDCVNTLQKRKTLMVVKTISDDESEASDDETDKSNVVALTIIVEALTISDSVPVSEEVIDNESDEHDSAEDLERNLKELYSKLEQDVKSDTMNS